MTTCEEAKHMRSGINVKGTIVDKGEIRTVNSPFGETKVCDAELVDGSGRIKLTLWAGDAEKVNIGDKVSIEGGYWKTFRGEERVHKSRNDGKLEVIQDSDKPEPEAEPEAEPELEAKPCEYCGSKGKCAESCRCDTCKKTRYLGYTPEEEEEILKERESALSWGRHAFSGYGGVANKDRGKK